MNTLPRSALLELAIDVGENSRLVQAPDRPDQILKGSIAEQPLHDHRLRQPLQEIHHGTYVGGPIHQRDGSPANLFRHRCAADRVQIVNFDGIDLLPRNLVRRRHHVGMRFAGKPQHHVHADVEAPPTTSPHRIQKRSRIMAPIHPLQGTVMHRLHPIFDANVAGLRQLRQQIEDIIGHAIGASPDCQSHDLGMRSHRFVQGTQSVHRGVSIRGRLKIGQKPLTSVAALKSTNPFFELRNDRLPGKPTTGTEAAIVAKNAPAGGNATVHIRASESPVDANFLDPLTEKLP